MPNLQLVLACGDYDRVRPLRDGAVRPEGIELTFLPLPPEEVFWRQLVHREFDASEMSLGSYVLGRSNGDLPLVAIPVFPSRMFRHSAIFVNAEAGIARPEDLRGRRVGVPEYQLTAAVWVRGILQDAYGVRPESLLWRTGGLEHAGRREKLPVAPPPGVRVEPIPADRTLHDMLESGEIDALVSPRTPESLGRGRVRRLFPDYRAAELEYFRRTRVFPIMHTLVIRKDVYERHRWIAQSLFKAFDEAKRRVAERIYDTNALPYMLPWMHADLEEVYEVLGRDFWPYGLEANRATLETFLRYAREQGLARADLGVEDLFAPETLDTFRV